MKQIVQQVCAWLPVVGLLVVWGSLFFNYGLVEQIALLFTGVAFVVDYAVNCRWQQWRMKGDKWPFVIAILFFLLLPIWTLVGLDKGPDIYTYFETMLPFLIFGLVGMVGHSDKLRVEYFALVGLSVVMVVSILILCQLDIHSLFHDINHDTNVFNIQRHLYSDSHMRFNLYANMSLTLGVATLLQPLKHRLIKGVIGVEMLVVMLVVFMSEGRTGVATMVVIVGLSVFYWMWRKNHAVGILIGVAGMVIGGLVVFHSVGSHQNNPTQDPRRYIWSVALEQIQDHPVLGYGPSQGHAQFVDRCVADEDVRRVYIPMLYSYQQYDPDSVLDLAHPHNLFLETTIAYGVVGCLILVLLLLSPIVCAPYGRRFVSLLVVLVYTGQAMFEHLGGDLNPMLLLIALLVLSDPLDASAAPETKPIV